MVYSFIVVVVVCKCSFIAINKKNFLLKDNRESN